MHNCPECGLAHEEMGKPATDPMVTIAKVEAERDIEVAKIAAGVSRDEMMREIEALRAELTVRREEPPVAETEITQVEVDAEPALEEPPAELPAEVMPEPDPEPEPPAETEPMHQEEKRSKGWFG